jgi:hypothetical protein
LIYKRCITYTTSTTDGVAPAVDHTLSDSCGIADDRVPKRWEPEQGLERTRLACGMHRKQGWLAYAWGMGMGATITS